jgi:hypothetical protein
LSKRQPRGARFALALLLAGAAIARAEVGFDCPKRPDFKNLRYEENWHSLSDPTCMDGLLDRLKFMPLDDTQQVHLSLGGEARLRYEFTNNPNFGANRTDANGYFLKRYLAHADLHVSERARLFVQLESANESGRLGGPRAEDEDDADFNQAFADLELYRDGEQHATLRLGRQELEFGASRLLSARDGLNTRQSFDGVRSFGRLGRWNYSTTAAQPVNTVPGAFDNYSSPRNQYAGASAWTAIPGVDGANLTLLSVFRRRQDVCFDAGCGVDERYTTGVRVWGGVAPWDYNWEGGIQRGEFDGLGVRAWYFATDTGWSPPGVAMQPRFGVRFDATSGDRDPTDGSLNTFNALFASTAYSGLAGQLGPSNVIDIAPSVSFSPAPDFRVNLGVIGFWRTSREDGIHSTSGSLRRSGRTSDARHVGTQSTIQGVYTPTRNWTLLAILTYFESGRFLEETPPGEDVTYFTAWATFRF